MKIFGKVTARTLILSGAAEMTFVILLCYVLAVTHHHVKPWLPTISACGENPPEQYPFRFGIMVGAMLLLVEAVSLHAAKISASTTYVLGVVASICLGIVAVVAANENNTVHTTAAVIFFVFEDFMNIFLMVDSAPKISRLSLIVKLIANIIAVVSTTIRLMIIFNVQYPFMQSLVTSGFPLLAIVEWSNTAAIVVFQVSLSADIHNLWLAVADFADTADTSHETHKTKLAPTIAQSAPPLPVNMGVMPPNLLPRNKEVIMFLEKVDR